VPLLLGIDDRVLDWLMVKYGSRDLPLIWVARYQVWFLIWTSYVLSGWMIARRYQHAASGALIPFTSSVMLRAFLEAAERWYQQVGPYWMPLSPMFFLIDGLVAPLLIVAGGCLALGVRRRSQTDTSTT
jgi:hypothetical protein